MKAPMLPRLVGRAASGGPELEALGALIVGTWESPGSRHVHEWGVGRLLIHSRSYSGSETDWVLVSEGIWYWDPEERVIRGIHVAVDMPVQLFDYWTVVEDHRVVHDLRAHGESSDTLIETWTYEGDAYRWLLERPGPGGLEPVMHGSYDRIRRSPSVRRPSETRVPPPLPS